MGRYFILSLLILIPVGLSAQKMPEVPANSRRLVVKDDTVCVFHVRLKNREIRTDQEKIYAWYASGAISASQATYTGYLLDGEFIQKLRNQTLLEKGRFDRGLKDDLWNKWYSNGRLKSQIKWKRGLKHGRFKEFASDGKLKRSGRYRKGKLHGKVLHYLPDGKVLKLIYKRGRLVKEVYPKQNLENEKNSPARHNEKPTFWSKLFDRNQEENTGKQESDQSSTRQKTSFWQRIFGKRKDKSFGAQQLSRKQGEKHSQ